jgi:predicted nuclease of predicted toxin-antitoxin system
MKLLADHCVFGKTIRLLRERGHEVLTLKELDHASSPDEIVLQLAQKGTAVLITSDREFGNILRYPPERSNGIVVLKITPSNQSRVHRFLLDFLQGQSRSSLRGKLVVVDTHHVRMRG